MAISFYCGLPGHGKSLSVVKNVIVPNLKAGRSIITNIPLNLTGERLQYASLVDTIPVDSKMEDLFKLEFAGKLLILDEFWRFCPSGVKTNNIPEEFKQFWAMHRHITADGFSTEIVLISQGANQICAFVKSLIEKTFHVTKLKIGFLQSLKTNVYTGCYPDKGAQFVQTQNATYDKDYFDWYQSQTQNTGLISTETDSDRRDNLLSVGLLKWGFPLALLVIAVGSWYVYNSLSEGIAPTAKPKAVPAGSDKVPDKVLDKAGKDKDSPKERYILEGALEFTGAMSYKGYRVRVELPDGGYYHIDQDSGAKIGLEAAILDSCHVLLFSRANPAIKFDAFCHHSDDRQQAVASNAPSPQLADAAITNPFGGQK